MPSAHLFFVVLVLTCPVFAALHAMSLVVPVYLILLATGAGLLYLLINLSEGLLFEEVISLVTMFGGFACLVAGFALAPLPIQLLATIALCFFGKRYQAKINLG